jgi:hypothetical protein
VFAVLAGGVVMVVVVLAGDEVVWWWRVGYEELEVILFHVKDSALFLVSRVLVVKATVLRWLLVFYFILYFIWDGLWWL